MALFKSKQEKEQIAAARCDLLELVRAARGESA
jgi:hypothetical protein